MVGPAGRPVSTPPPAPVPSVGDKFPNVVLPGADGVVRNLYNEVGGRPGLVMVLARDTEQQAALRLLTERASALAAAGADVFVIAGGDTPCQPASSQPAAGPVTVFLDQRAEVVPGLLPPEAPAFPEVKAFQPTCALYLLDPNQRLLARLSRNAVADQLDKAQALLEAWQGFPRDRQVFSCGAPVLMLPNIFEPALCRELMELWHQGHQEGSVSDGRQNVYSPDTKKNREHVISEPEISHRISMTLARRIGPELAKVFNYTAPFRFEGHIVLCYTDDRQDFFGLHRDTHRQENPRRFACSTNLNDDFEGGELYFPEYGPYGYKPPAGGSAIFACGLLHEARPVTKGTRFVVTSFFCAAEQPGQGVPSDRRRQMQV